MEEGELAGAVPAEDVAVFSGEGGGAAGCVKLCWKGRFGDLFESGDGEGARGVVAEDADYDGAAVVELGDGGGVAEDVVEGFGGTFGCCGFEDADFRLRDW